MPQANDASSREARIRAYRAQAAVARERAKSAQGSLVEMLLFEAAKWDLVASKLERQELIDHGD